MILFYVLGSFSEDYNSHLGAFTDALHGASMATDENKTEILAACFGKSSKANMQKLVQGGLTAAKVQGHACYLGPRISWNGKHHCER